jgi:hypothetical protein
MESATKIPAGTAQRRTPEVAEMCCGERMCAVTLGRGGGNHEGRTNLRQQACRKSIHKNAELQ